MYRTFTYQETANSYTMYVDVIDPNYAHDGLWNSNGAYDITGPSWWGVMYEKYTKPEGVKFGSLYRFGHQHNIDGSNVTINQNCFNCVWSPVCNGYVSFTTFTINNQSVKAVCQTNDATVSIFQNDSNLSNNIITETGVYWFIADTEGIEKNIDNISSINLTKNDQWILSCRASNSTTESAWVNSSTITISNSVPTSPLNSTINDANQINETIEATGIGSTDGDNDSITYYYEFRCNATDGLLLQSNSTDSTWTINNSCGKDSTVYVLIRAYDGTDKSSLYEVETKAILNTIPTAPTGSSLNTGNQIGESLIGTGAGSTDVDNDAITYYYEFRCNATDGDLLQDDSTDNSWIINNSCGKDSTVYVLIRGYDGTDKSSSYEVETKSIVNSRPIAPTGSSLNTGNQVGESLEATGEGSTDVDNDATTYYYEFRCNATDGDLLQDDSTDNSWIITNSCGKDSTVYVLIRGYDGTSKSSTYETETKLILNTIPSSDNVTVSISPEETNLTVNLTCQNDSSFFDADQDSVTQLYKWYLNDTFQNVTTQVLTNDSINIGELWKCSVTPFDGESNGTEIFSESVSIGTGYQAPIIILKNATTDGTISNSINPTNQNETVNISVQFTDMNENETWRLFICKESGANASGCIGDEWCSTDNLSNSTTLSCGIDALAQVFGSYSYYAHVIDNNSLISSASIGSFYIGDDIPPNILCLQVSDITTYTTDILYMYANCSDENNISSAKFHLYSFFDDGATYDANITSYSPYSGNQYRVSKATSSAGIWGLMEVYCLDQSGNVVSWTDGINITASIEEIGGGGGGGGGGTDTIITIDLDSQIEKYFEGYVQFQYPGDIINIPWVPITKDYEREVIIQAIDGSVNTKIEISDNLKPYFSYEVCDLYTKECSDEINILEGEKKFVRIKGSITDEEFNELFMNNQPIIGTITAINATNDENGVYQILIEKGALFDKSQDLADKWNSFSVDFKINQKAANYIIKAVMGIMILAVILVAIMLR